MAFATGARHELSFIAESVFGTTPVSPAMKRLRHKSTTLNLTKQSFTSEEIRADRQIVDMRHGTKQVGGDIAFELSYGSFDDFLEAACFNTFATDVLKVGTTFKSFTIERRFLDVGRYGLFTGCAVNTLSLSIRPNAIVEGTLGIVGKDGSYSAASIDSTIEDVTTNSPFDSFSGVLEEGEASIATVTALELNLNNGLDPAFVVGSATTPQIVFGRSNLTGTLSAYFENQTLLNKFINETESSLSLALTDPAGNELEIELPRIKYSGGDLPVQGEGGITMSMPFQALYDQTAGSNLVITRTPVGGGD